MAPAHDVDLFMYGLKEQQAIEKVTQIEPSITDIILSQTTTTRTKNAITIVSAHPTGYVPIILRLYHSGSENVTGF